MGKGKKREPERGKGRGGEQEAKKIRGSPITDVELYRRVVVLFRQSVNHTVDSALEALCSSHPQYNRMPRGVLQNAVAKCLRHCREETPVLSASLDTAASHEHDRDSEKDQEHEEGDEDQELEGDESDAGNNLMNNRLRATYSKVSKAAAKNVAIGSSKLPSSGGGDNADDVDVSGKGDASRAVLKARYSDVGGIEHCIQDVRELIEHPIRHPEIYQHLGVRAPTGVLLHGPPGTGKTLLAHAIAGELGVPFLSISAPEIVSGFSGQSEKRIRALFQEARKKAPCIVFIDEIDAVTPKRESAQREMERRIVAQLLTCMDDLAHDNEDGTPAPPVLVLGATNRPDSLDPALRRAGRFDREISLGVPDKAARCRILKVMTRNLRLAGDFDFEDLARRTPGFVGADLVALTKEAAMVAVNRIFHGLANDSAATTVHDEGDETAAAAAAAGVGGGSQRDERKAAAAEDLRRREEVAAHLRDVGTLTPEELAPLFIQMDDFERALPKVQPSAKREGFATVPDVTWSDIGALDAVRSELQMAIVNAIRHPEAYASLGLDHPAGVLLYGPPGCGKTLLARAVANDCGASFISVKGPELLNKYVGESERAVRQVFERARASAPCVVFFDEMDALVPRRGHESQASERVVNQLLTELDGLESRRMVFVVGATNRPDIFDPAMLRPGRLEKLLYVPLPTPEDRVKILSTLTKERPRLSPDLDLGIIAADARCTGFSGADLAALVREASMAALQEAFVAGGNDGTEATAARAPRQGDLMIGPAHFEKAFRFVSPSVSPADAKRYEGMRDGLSRNRLK